MLQKNHHKRKPASCGCCQGGGSPFLPVLAPPSAISVRPFSLTPRAAPGAPGQAGPPWSAALCSIKKLPIKGSISPQSPRRGNPEFLTIRVGSSCAAERMSLDTSPRAEDKKHWPFWCDLCWSLCTCSFCLPLLALGTKTSPLNCIVADEEIGRNEPRAQCYPEDPKTGMPECRGCPWPETCLCRAWCCQVVLVPTPTMHLGGWHQDGALGVCLPRSVGFSPRD